MTRSAVAASIGVFLLVAACAEPTAPSESDTTAPAILREMRGVWIATVANIDWPSRNNLTADQQKSELLDLLDRAANAGLNTVVFQVRPAGDAVYASSLEPWASLLTGTQGTNPGYDPLAFAIAEAHARGLELHAWINPFRAGNTRDTATFAATHIFKTRRDLVRVYGSQVWMDPGEPEVQDRTILAVLDILDHYDVDGIHADDYFYPYQETNALGQVIGFPDTATYKRSGSVLTIDNWRRQNIDGFVGRLYAAVHAKKQLVKVGISPFGIWRPGNPSGVTGLDAYATLYADSRKWLQQGWVDYMSPQLYWAITAPQQSYPALLDWWLGQNTTRRHVWPGLAAYRVDDGTSSAFASGEIAAQVKATRDRATASGTLLYNANTTLKRNGGAVAATLASMYSQRALVPAFTWLDATPPPEPVFNVNGANVALGPNTAVDFRWWYVRAHVSSGWITRTVFGSIATAVLPGAPDRVLVNAVDKAGNASVTVEWIRAR